METSYLSYIATISKNYVSFTSFFLALRQIIGSTIDRGAAWLIRYLIADALCVTATALMPPLMVLFPSSCRPHECHSRRRWFCSAGLTTSTFGVVPRCSKDR